MKEFASFANFEDPFRDTDRAFRESEFRSVRLSPARRRLAAAPRGNLSQRRNRMAKRVFDE
jgi:hypothetical protein